METAYNMDYQCFIDRLAELVIQYHATTKKEHEKVEESLQEK